MIYNTVIPFKDGRPIKRFRDNIEQVTKNDLNDLNNIEIDIEAITNETFEKIKLHVNKEYLLDSKCVYKICTSGPNIYLVVLQKQPGVMTNESRETVVSANYAKFRANELMVKQIIDITSSNNMNSCVDHIIHKTSYYSYDIGIPTKIEKSTIYKVNCNVKADMYCQDVNDICAGGIHYFKTLQAAYFLWLDYSSNYSGLWFSCDSDGKTETINVIENGRIIHTIFFSDNCLMIF